MDCGDARTALECREGMWASIACDGPGGCRKRRGVVACAQDYAAEGDRCPSSAAGLACRQDRRATLACRDGALRAGRACLGPGGCAVDAGVVACDAVVAAVGEACEAGERACADDRRAALGCVDGHFAVELPCRGPAGCAPRGDAVACDDSVGEEGAPCAGGVELCAADGVAVLGCQDGVLGPTKTCASPKRCTIEHGVAACR